MPFADADRRIAELKELYPGKFLKHEEIFRNIRRGDRIFVGTGCSEPRHLVKAFMEHARAHPKAFFDAELSHLLALGLTRYEADDYEAAGAAYERALALKADFPEAWNDLGVARFRSGDYAGARACFGKAVALRADYEEALFNLADCCDELGLGRERDAARSKLKALGLGEKGEE